MNDSKSRYLALHKKLVELRQAGAAESEEDAVNELLDVVWAEMTSEERAQVRNLPSGLPDDEMD